LNAKFNLLLVNSTLSPFVRNQVQQLPQLYAPEKQDNEDPIDDVEEDEETEESIDEIFFQGDFEEVWTHYAPKALFVFIQDVKGKIIKDNRIGERLISLDVEVNSPPYMEVINVNHFPSDNKNMRNLVNDLVVKEYTINITSRYKLAIIDGKKYEFVKMQYGGIDYLQLVVDYASEEGNLSIREDQNEN
jgi:hypothetical protein